jgi:hypothetical protein
MEIIKKNKSTIIAEILQHSAKKVWELDCCEYYPFIEAISRVNKMKSVWYKPNMENAKIGILRNLLNALQKED